MSRLFSPPKADASTQEVGKTDVWGEDLPVKELTDNYVAELRATLERMHKAQNDVFDDRERALQERETIMAENQRGMARGERKLMLAWEELAREQEALAEENAKASARAVAAAQLFHAYWSKSVSWTLFRQVTESQRVLAETEARLTSMSKDLTAREARLESAEAALETQRNQLGEGERSLAKGEARLVEGWESLYREQEALAKSHKESDLSGIKSSLSSRATDLVQREQGVAETATRLAAAMAAFSQPDDHRAKLLTAREEAVKKREDELEQQLEARFKAHITATEELARGDSGTVPSPPRKKLLITETGAKVSEPKGDGAPSPEGTSRGSGTEATEAAVAEPFSHTGDMMKRDGGGGEGPPKQGQHGRKKRGKKAAP